MYNILICDDDRDIVEALKIYLSGEDYRLFTAYNGQEALEAVRQHEIHCILMDVMMPHLDGFSAVKEIRKNKDIPVIMLSARGEEYDKLFAFEIGVDDYVTKPFSPKEVMARINAVTKRRKAKTNGNEILKFEGLEIDMAGRNVYVDGEKVELTPKEYELLVYFKNNRRVALSREAILNAVWGYDYFGDLRTVDTHIKKLRAKLGACGGLIGTVRGYGYRFDADLTR